MILTFLPALEEDNLCPWCDRPLPDKPSPRLEKLMAESKRHGWRDATRPWNPNAMIPFHLKHTIDVCARHRFEMDELPRALSKGWVKDVDWDEVINRIMHLSVLERILEVIRDPRRSIKWRRMIKKEAAGVKISRTEYLRYEEIESRAG